MLSIMNEIDPYLLLLLCVLYEIQNQIYHQTTQRIPQSAEYVVASSMTVPMNEASQEQVQYINNRNYNYRGNLMPNYYHP